MNRVFALIACSAGAMMAIAGCGESSPSGNDNPNNADRLVPLAVGNQWIYETTTTDSTGKSSTKSDTTRITRDTTIQGEKWFFFNNDVAPTVSRTDGVYSWDPKTNTARIFVRYPGTVGSSYERGSQRYTISSINTTVSVPAGDFACYQVTVTDQNAPRLLGTISIAPGIGTIKIEALDKRTDGSVKGSIRMELKSYTLKYTGMK